MERPPSQGGLSVLAIVLAIVLALTPCRFAQESEEVPSAGMSGGAEGEGRRDDDDDGDVGLGDYDSGHMI